MKTKNFHKYLIIAIVGFFLTTHSTYSQTRVKEGHIDLSSYDLFNDNPVELNGVWEFYPDKLLSPSDFDSAHTNVPIYVDVPSLWNKSHFPNKEFFNIAYGTYRLKIKLNNDINVLAIRLKRIETSYKLWFNESLILEIGKVADSKEKALPQQKTITKVFPVNQEENEIIIQVSNFHHRKGGIDNSITVGTPNKVINKTRIAGAYEMFLIGVLLIMAVFHMGLFLFGRKEYSLLFFSILLIIEIISLSTNGEVLLTKLFPDLQWVILKKIDYISNFLRLTFLAWFFYKVYSKEISKLYIIALTILNIGLTFIVIFTNLSFYSFTLFIFIIAGGITILYILIALIVGMFRKKHTAFISFLGTLILLITVVNDILFIADIIQTLFLIPFGFFVFIFAQSYILSFNFSNLYKNTERLNLLTFELDELKNNLLQKTTFDLKDSVKILVEKTGATLGSLYTVLNEKHILKSKYSKDENPNIQVILHDSLLQTSIEEKRSIQLSEIDKQNSSKGSSVSIPLIISENVRAILYLENKNKKHVFSQFHIELIEILSDQIVGLIDNINIYKELEDLNINLEKIISNRTKDIRSQRDLLEEQKNEIEAINSQLNETLEEISKKNRIIRESIKFASLTQKTNLPSNSLLSSLFADYFVLFRPKEELSGDFYWAKKINIDNKEIRFLSITDCTGHGVPGALMSVIGNGLLNDTIINKKIYKPSNILDKLQEQIDVKMGQDRENKAVKDGMDMALISYDHEENILEYAGAKIDLIIFRNGKYTEVKADKISIGADQHTKFKDKKFTNRKIKIKKGDIIYLSTDGFQDQFGGEKDTKFMKKNFKLLLEEINQLSFTIQKSRLLKNLNRWQGDRIQNDDISVIGLKF